MNSEELPSFRDDIPVDSMAPCEGRSTRSPDLYEDSASFLEVKDPEPQRGWGKFALRWSLSREVFRMAMPVVLGMVTQTAINILDGAMVGRLPKEEANPGQAAIGLALPFMWLVGGFLSAVWVGTQALTSRRAGERRPEAAGQVFTNSLVIALSSSLVVSALAIAATPSIIGALYTDAALVEFSVGYLRIRFVGIVAMVATFSFKSFFDGLGKTRVFMTAAVLMNAANVVLNFLLIYGHAPLGVPRLGVEGAAWASVIASYLGLALLAAWSLVPSVQRRYRYYRLSNLDAKVARKIVWLSLPNGAGTIVVMIGFSAFYWVVGQVNAISSVAGNPVVATANQVVIMTAMPSFMTSLAFGTATAAMVGQSLGAGRPELGQAYAWEGVRLWAYVMGLLGVFMAMFPHPVLSLFTQDQQVIAMATTPLRMVAALHAVFPVAMILAQTLYGIGQSKFVMVVELLMHLFVMSPLAYLFGLVLDFGLPGVWLGPLIYAVVFATIMVIKFQRGDWKEIEI